MPPGPAALCPPAAQLYFGGEVAEMLPQREADRREKQPIQYNLTAELVTSSAPSFRDLSSTGPMFNPV